MNSAQLVAKKIRDIKVTDRDFLMSSALISYLRSMLSIPCKHIGKRVPACKMIYQAKENATIACTNGIEIILNAGHPFVKRNAKNRVSKVRILTGLMVHEFGHYRFTDVAGRQAPHDALLKGKFYPVMSEKSLAPDLADNMADFEAYIRDNPTHAKHCVMVWHNLDNILEDAYIEECLFRTITGQLIDGLDFVRRKMKTTAQPLSELLDVLDENPKALFPIIKSLLLTYAKFGTMLCDWRNPRERDSEPVQWIRKCRPYVDAVLTESNTRIRVTTVNKVFLTLWPLIRDFVAESADKETELEELLKEFTGDMESTEYSGKGDGKPTPVSEDEDTGKSGSASRRSVAKRCMDRLDKGDRKTKPEKKSDASKPDEGPHEDGESGVGKESEEKDESKPGAGDSGKEDDTKKGASESTTPAEGEAGDELDGSTTDATGPDEDEGEVEPWPDAEDTEPEVMDVDSSWDEKELSDSLLRIEKEIREAEAIAEVNDELTEELKKEASSTDYGAAHKGIKTTLKRVRSISPEAKETLEPKIAAINDVAMTMVKKVLPELKKNDGMELLPMTGYFSGSKFDATRLVMNDCRYFRQGATPLPDTRLALSVLVDESGSMGGGGRIEMARTAALALYLFCEKAGIKCSVIGHTSEFGVGDLRLQVYADYETPDKDDKYRILDIKAQEDNRDGAAILFSGEHLLKREEPTKLMIIISDGAPLATGYRGVAAETDMSNIVAELRRKGVIVFAAAIGDDKANIHRIYGDGFIDITNLATLPDQLLKLVRRYIR